ncbi:MAG: FAD-binding oxidoreductase [Actinomycetota bacterium]|nr:FAD-binding oxidoreductase [Actinomycetota bacterium]
MRVRSDLPRSADLVIIGGGVVGAATAFFASRAGLRPLLIEARPALCTLTTPRATGAFRLQFDNREELEMVRESVQLFLEFREVTGQDAYDLGVRQQGYLWLTTSQDGAQRQRRLVQRQHGWGLMDVETLTGDEVRVRFPYVGTNVVQGRFRAGDGFLDTVALTLGLAEASGADIVLDTPVTGFRITGGRLEGVVSRNSAVATSHAVVACGPLSGIVAGVAGADLPIRTVRRQKLVMPDVPEVPQDAPMTIDEDTGTHWRPALLGAWLLCTDPDTQPSPPSWNVPADREFGFQILDPSSPAAAARIVPFWRDVWERGEPTWYVEAGQYTMTPDHRPLIGPTRIEGLYVNSGYSGHGIMGSPAGSRILVDVLTGRMRPQENPFRVDRQFVAREFDRL